MTKRLGVKDYTNKILSGAVIGLRRLLLHHDARNK